MIALLVALVHAGSEADPQDLREDLGGGAAVNWTTLTLEVARSGQGRGIAGTRKAVEHDVRTGLGPAVAEAALAVRVSADAYVDDLVADEALGEAVEARLGRWTVGESRYHASGRIELVAELRLIDLLKPWSLVNAPPRPEAPREPGLSGVLVDARGIEALPSWAPRLLDEHDRVLWDGTVWEDVALAVPPVSWIPDPAHPGVARVGPNPLILRAAGVRGADLVLDPLDAVRFRTALSSAEVLREGTVVVVVDP
jgi:hypothetical protein